MPSTFCSASVMPSPGTCPPFMTKWSSCRMKSGVQRVMSLIIAISQWMPRPLMAVIVGISMSLTKFSTTLSVS